MSRSKLGYRIVTGCALAAAAAGVALPLLPTAPFLLLAAWSASHHSPELEARLLDNPRVGPHIRAWREERALSRQAKRGALLALALSYAVTLFAVPLVSVKVGLGVLLAGVALFLLTRPSPRHEGSDSCD
ncbi:MAG: hypothetical protein CMQ43_11295 [Gammaproteobacteria bacterium]|mgnify:CR=1 FL=1|nr:hypothetical protein [Gammaproteobacteria bacterium]|tara:strand:+ start:2393 stop:2782 length:390 start_codon:yes stop_codon:yes gene_type:complete